MDKEWRLHILDYLKGRWRPSEIVARVFEMQSRWHPNVCGMEVNGFQRTLKLACEEEMRKRKEYFPIEEIRNGPERSKADRIKTLEPFYRAGSVTHAAWMKGKDLEIELQTFPKGKHDDLIDAMSMCLPLLNPGSDAVTNEEDDWDKWTKIARQNSQPFKGFFDYGR